MATQEVAQSVPDLDASRKRVAELLGGGPFYNGPDSMVAPHLPVGSPERSELFRELRKTFSEDWRAAEEAVERERLEAKGDLYFIQCGEAVKIGHTRDIVNRLHNMRVNSPLDLDCLLLLKGRGHEEKRWHRQFRHLLVRGEWFRLAPELETAIVDAREQQRQGSIHERQ